MSDVLLSLAECTISYGPVQAVKGISLSVHAGEITALVGANGAGKTTTLLGISGIVKPRSGRIVFEGRETHTLPPHKIVRRGIVHVPEGRDIFKYISVRENLSLGAYTRNDRDGIKADQDWVLSLFPVLKARIKSLAGNLSGGEQQMLAIARGLMSRPKLLLLDEPSMGLAPMLVEEIFSTLLEINRSGLSILLVEQNIRKALAISARGYVLETGRITLEGKSDELLNDPGIMAAYLGG
jgi:branched-chain amino acid transport system ATP-binding protein